MLVHFIKFLHVLLAISVLGFAFFCLAAIRSKKWDLHRLNKAMLWLTLFAMLTGTLLVYPTQFTFHTPWIQAAYLLVLIVALIILLLIFFRKKVTDLPYWIEFSIYFVLIILLIFVIHDAVTKTTFLL